jgi:uncharacterized protein YuzE
LAQLTKKQGKLVGRRIGHVVLGFLLFQRLDQYYEVNMAHTTEFPFTTGPVSRPVDVMRLLAKGGLPLQLARSVVERLATADMKGRYYHERDSLYIEIAPGPSAETRAVAHSLKVDLDADGNIIGFDIDNASRLGALLRDFVASGATVEDLARAWASLDRKRNEFDKEKGPGASAAAHRYYLAYLAEAEEILRRAANYARERSSMPSSPADAATAPALPEPGGVAATGSSPANPATAPALPAETNEPGPAGGLGVEGS